MRGFARTVLGFVVGLVVGVLAMIWLSEDAPVISIDGVMRVDTTSDRDLGGRHFLEAGAVIHEPVYLNFASRDLPRGLVGDTVGVRGGLTHLGLRDGGKVPVLIVDGQATVAESIDHDLNQAPGSDTSEPGSDS